MGNFTPKPINQQRNRKFSSKGEKVIKLKPENEDVPQIKNKYKKLNIRNMAPNCVQKNIKQAASTQRRVFAKLYRIKNEGTRSNSYDKKNKINESVKNKTYPAIKINVA